MTTATASRRVSKARTEVGYSTGRHHRGSLAGKVARRAYHRAVRRAAAAEIAEALAE
jgi:hypothetical protein